MSDRDYVGHLIERINPEETYSFFTTFADPKLVELDNKPWDAQLLSEFADSAKREDILRLERAVVEVFNPALARVLSMRGTHLSNRPSLNIVQDGSGGLSHTAFNPTYHMMVAGMTVEEITDAINALTREEAYADSDTGMDMIRRSLDTGLAPLVVDAGSVYVIDGARLRKLYDSLAFMGSKMMIDESLGNGIGVLGGKHKARDKRKGAY